MKRTTLALLVLLLAAFPLLAQQGDGLEKGFAADKVYDFGGIDSINTFNGNLAVNIPLGPAYPVNGGFEYGLTLAYNSKVWDYEGFDGQLRAIPSRRSNAGMGWLLSLGRLIPPSNPTNEVNQWVYESPDANEHIFFDKLHKDDAATSFALPVTAVRYTRDGSYLRLLERNDGTTLLEFPDGRIHTFSTSTGVLQKIQDRTSNSATITYLASPAGTPCPAGGTNVWQITDSKSARTNYVCFKALSTPESLYTGIVDRVILAAPASATGGAQNVTYTFNHTLMSIMRGCHHQIATDPLFIDNVPMLTSVTQPDGSSFSFTYNPSDAGISECWRGTLKMMTLPTGGNIAYTDRNYLVPNDECGRQTFNTRLVGVATKTMSGPRVQAGTWTYSSALSTPAGQVVCSNGSIITNVPPPAEEMTVTVKDPLNHVTEHYYSVWPGVPGFPSPNGFSEYEYGLPLTRKQSTASVVTPGATAYLSRRVYSAAGYAASPRQPLRSTYVVYERDATTCGGPTHTCNNANARSKREIVVYHDDADRKGETYRDAFDGFGHYRRTIEGGTFAGAASESYTAFNVRDANVNPTTGISTADYLPGDVTFTPPAASTPWVLENSSSSSVTEGTVKLTTQTCYDAGNGLLRAIRNVAANAPGGQTTNVVTVYRFDANGNATSETSFGAIDGNAPVQPLCAIADLATLPSPNVRVDHTYQWGVRATSRTAGATFFSLDRTIDRYTGVPRSSRDTAGLATSFTYDSLFRMSVIGPPGLAATSFTHNASSGTTTSTFVPARVRASSTATGLGTKQSEYQYDALGRLWREKTFMPDSTWSVRETLFDAAGNVASRSEQQKLLVVTTEYDFVPTKKTTFTGYDPFGRAGTVSGPDGKSVTFQFKGDSEKKRIESVAGTAGEVSVTTTETYDRHGRLFSVTQGAGTPAAHTTSYQYDPASRLVRVEMPGAAGTQVRTFTYDYRGFLTQERHPEHGTTGNGVTDYLNYNVNGKPHRKRTGPTFGAFDLAYEYDVTGRVTLISLVSSAEPLKQFAYDDPSGLSFPHCAGNRCNGKLAAAARYNYSTDLGTVAVTESYQYDAATGLLSRRDTAVGSGTSFTGESFNVSQTYNAFGDVLQKYYPCRTGPADCNTADPARPIVGHGYTNGFLTSVGTWASSITYAPNAMIDTVTHGSGTSAVREKWVGDSSGLARPCGIYLYGPGVTLTADATANCGQRLTGSGAQWTSGMYSYDGAGNVKQIGNDTYAYDAFGRLTNWTVSGVAGTRAYDTWGNVTGAALTVNGTTNRYTQMTYDAGGNVTNDGTRTYAYDSMSMATAANAGGRAFRFVYTPSDERVAAVERINVGGVMRNKTTWTLRGMNNELQRVFVSDATSGTTIWSWKENTFWRGSSLLADETPSGLRHYGLDHLGSPRLITTAAGALAGTQSFAPFGSGGTSNGGALQFTGQERDSANLAGGSVILPDYFHARYYDTGTGRFLSVDRLLGSAAAPQSWNRYAYALNNPLAIFDPNGLKGVYVFNLFTDGDLDQGMKTEVQQQLRDASVQYFEYNANIVDQVTELSMDPTNDIILVGHTTRMAGSKWNNPYDFSLGGSNELIASGVAANVNSQSFSVIGCNSAGLSCSLPQNALDVPGVEMERHDGANILLKYAAELALRLKKKQSLEHAARNARHTVSKFKWKRGTGPLKSSRIRKGRKRKDPFKGTGFVSADNVRH